MRSAKFAKKRLLLAFIKNVTYLKKPLENLTASVTDKRSAGETLHSNKLQGLKYLFWGGFNVLLSWILYFVTFHYIISKNNVEILPFLTISGHIFSFLLSFVITFFTGFAFNNFLVFSSAKREPIYKKLFRYFLANMGSLLINYVLLKIFVEYFMFYPTPSQILCTFIVTIYSFLIQKKFTFRK